MNIQTGKTPLALSVVLAILALSLVVNLPGLAITPMLSSLSHTFPGTTQTEKQLLTIMPNLLIIPFVLLSGKLSMTRHKIATIVCGLALFVLSGIAYLFAHTMTELIIISCVLGCAAGLIIPFAAGLIADCFVGPKRMKMMGLKSGTSNISLVLATFVVGWLSGGNWHLPFIVYLIGIIPLVMALWLRKIPQQDLVNPQIPDDVKANVDAGSRWPKNGRNLYHGFYLSKVFQVIGIYLFITFATMLISYYSPFLIEAEHMPDSLTGTVTAIFYLFIFLPGFLLTRIVKLFKNTTFIASAVMILVGIAIFCFLHNPVCLCIGAALAGLGYGICQPLIYDKASRTVENPSMATLALAIVLAANYIAIAVAPFIVDLFRDIFHAQNSQIFPFYVAGVSTVIYLVIALLRRNTFGFAINKTYY